MEKICSFRDKEGKCIEYLDEHIELAMKYYKEYFLDCGINETIAGRLRRMDHSLMPELVRAITELSIIMHDFGKTITYNHPGEHPPHELYSYIMVEAARSDIEQYVGRENVEAVAIPVLHHHMAMGGIVRGGSKITRIYRGFSLKPWEKRLLEDILSRYGYSINVRENYPRSLVFTAMQRAKKSLSYSVLPGKSIYDIILRILRILVIVDNMAAAEKRGGELRVFLTDLPLCTDMNRFREELASRIASKP